jgi:hypothetical protein
MILSNEDLLQTNTEDVLNQTAGSSSEDLKRTILSRQGKRQTNIVYNELKNYPYGILTDMSITKSDLRQNSINKSARSQY